jgi:hypothetical protein
MRRILLNWMMCQYKRQAFPLSYTRVHFILSAWILKIDSRLQTSKNYWFICLIGWWPAESVFSVFSFGNIFHESSFYSGESNLHSIKWNVLQWSLYHLITCWWWNGRWRKSPRRPQMAPSHHQAIHSDSVGSLALIGEKGSCSLVFMGNCGWWLGGRRDRLRLWKRNGCLSCDIL